MVCNFIPGEETELSRMINFVFDDFVGSEYSDLGKELLNKAIQLVKDKSNYLTVNSSIYAEKIYTKLGFNKTDVLQEKNGIKFIPMKMSHIGDH